MAGKLVCPLCGVSTSFSPLLLEGKGALLKDFDSDDIHYIDVGLRAVTSDRCMRRSSKDTGYAIVICQDCGAWFVAERQRYGREWLAVYPIPHKTVSQEIPEPIKSEFEEAYLCFAVEAYRGCLLVCRTALIDIQREQDVSNLKELVDKGIISNMLYGQADQVRLWANMIGHEELPETISKEDTEQLLDYLGMLLDTVYVQPKRLSDLSQKLRQLKEGAQPESS